MHSFFKIFKDLNHNFVKIENKKFYLTGKADCLLF